MPKISIIVPCYNTEKYLRTCLNSLVNQTLENIEILVIDDGSIDQTRKIIKEYEQQYPHKIKGLYFDKQHGISFARNQGMKIAKGEYFGFVDSDDVVSLEMFETLYQITKKEQKQIGITGLGTISSEDYCHQEGYQIPQSTRKPETIRYDKNPTQYFSEDVSCCNKIFSRSLIGDMKFLENHIFEDIAFSKVLLLKANEAVRISRLNYLYRKNPKGTMNSSLVPNRKILDILNVCLNARQMADTYQLNKTQMTLLKEELESHLISKLFGISQWDILEEDKKYILERLFAIYEFYFPNLLQFQYEYPKNMNAYCIEQLKKYKTFPNEFSLSVEKENVYLRILQLEKRKELN